MQHVRGAVGIPNLKQAQIMGEARNPAMQRALTEQPFDRLTYVILNGKFEDPVAERLRVKAAKRWNESIAVVQSISEAIQ